MYTQTIGDIFHWRGMSSGFLCVYVVKDGDIVLYVGRTRKSVMERINQHCATTSPDFQKTSSLGKHINRNIPISYDWTVHTYSIKESLLIIQQKYPHVEFVNHVDAELGLILVFKPALNIMNNTLGNAIPEKFQTGIQLDLF